jgi:uncharacterized protein (TIGR03437 family)
MTSRIAFQNAAAILLFALPAAAQEITFSEHIAPILYQNCVSCHRPGQVGPFPLLTYTDALRKSLTIRTATKSRYMPPWKPEPGWSAYADERHLTEAQIDLIQKWVQAGSPEGDPTKAPPVPVFSDDWQLGTPDLILEMPAAFKVPSDGTDVYRNFVIPTNLTQDKWVKAIELKPTARSVVHHVLFFSETTGGARQLDGADGQPGFPGLGSVFTVQGTNLNNILSGGLGGWVPGTTPARLPDGIAMPLPAGSDLLLQTHFHLDGIERSEKTMVGIYFGPAPARTLTQLQVPAFFGFRANIDIPAGMPNYAVRGSFTLPVDAEGVTISAHAHYLAREAKLTATLPSGEVKILLWIRDWDFRWQGNYTFKNLLPLPAGTRIDGEITYDNSAANPFNPNSPPKRVTWGEQSTDEMGSLILSVVPGQQAQLGSLQAATLAYIVSPVPQVGNRPLFISSGMVDGASTQSGTVTPGKVVVLYGQRLGPAELANTQLGSDGKITTSLGGTQVTFDGTPAPLIYTSSGQLAAIVPYSVDGRKGTQVQVANNGLLSSVVALPVTQAAPSIFSVNYTGGGQGAILNQDGITVNSSAKPAAKGSIIAIYATGEGQTNPPGVDGKLAVVPFPKPIQEVTVKINGVDAQVFYAGAAPGQTAGLMQVNARIPANTPSGNASVEIQVGNAKSQPGITVAVE